jgi:hypothetical protein
MASLRNPAIGILRLHSDRNIAAALGNAAQNIPICTRPERPPTTYRARITAARRAAIKSFRSVGNPDHGRAGRQPGRMFMHRQR